MSRDEQKRNARPLLTRREMLRAAGGLGLLGEVVTSASAAVHPCRDLTVASSARSTSLCDAVIEGKFGTALNAAWGGVDSTKVLDVYKTFPLTVEFWCKLDPRPRFYNFAWNHGILVSNEPRESADHWEIYLDQKDGYTNTVSAFLPGMTPEFIKSEKNISDGRWHYVAMVIDGNSLTLYADGEEAIKATITKKVGWGVIPGKLSVGKATLTFGGSFDFNGAIDDLRISNIAREIRGIPATPLAADQHTVGLWSFDVAGNSSAFLDSSVNANHLQIPVADSLDEIDSALYRAGPSPLDSRAQSIPLSSGAKDVPPAPGYSSLDGAWQLVEGESADWARSIKALVPGGVHAALREAGVIPDPYHGRNQDIAAEWSKKTYWYRKTFSRPPAGQDSLLVFHGICNRCTVWLNDQKLGEHEGMFTRLEYRIQDLLRETNTITVRLDSAIDWNKTVAFANAYDYGAKIPPLGIWRSVEVRGQPPVKIRDPFIVTLDAQAGALDLVVGLTGPSTGWTGKLLGVISAENFIGESYSFERSVAAHKAHYESHLAIRVPDPQLWWPVDIGKPNLYRLTLAFVPEEGVADVQHTNFGIRTIEMAPVNGRAQPRLYNWTFVVNGQPMFVKGANWFTCDALMNFTRERYQHFLALAVGQHIQMLRSWGYGLIETDDFYDLCDRAGILVMQEWPTSWNSQETQPFAILEETVRQNTLRLRNHPSLALYAAGNESSHTSLAGSVFGPAINMMGRLSIELDGTRAFHRAEPRGGADHDYTVQQFRLNDEDDAFYHGAAFYGEFGVISSPCYETVQRYLPDDEKDLWPAPQDKSFSYHSPSFGVPGYEDLGMLKWLSEYFTAGHTMERFIVGTQLAQAVGVRRLVERARSSWPRCTGALYFIFNDNCPGSSLSTVDWYGMPKISYYLIKDSFAPLVAAVLLPAGTHYGVPLAFPVYLLDDADALKNHQWEVLVRVYGADLNEIKRAHFVGTGGINRVAPLGEFTLAADQTKAAPLLVVTDVIRNSVPEKRNYYFTNFEPVKDCLFELPKTSLEAQAVGQVIIIKNNGRLPALGVEISSPEHHNTQPPSENYFWLDPGEEKRVAIGSIEGVVAKAWNT
jgi:beta-mannosidase